MARIFAFALALLSVGVVVKGQQPTVEAVLAGPLVVGGVDGKRTTLSLEWKDGRASSLKSETFVFTLSPIGFTVTGQDVEVVTTTRANGRTFTKTSVWPTLRLDVRNSGLVSIGPMR
jgi:hypothetical protein